MSPDHEHEQIDELLASYVLQALTGEDAAEADRLLATHVPSCLRCRNTLQELQDLTGDLALIAPAVAPPETLLPSIRRRTGKSGSSQRRPFFAYAAAAMLVVVIGLTGWNFMLSSQVTSAEQRQAARSSMLNTLMAEADSQMLTLDPEAPPTPAPSAADPVVIVSYHPGVQHVWVFGMNIPQPAGGDVYQVWLVRSGAPTASARFIPGPDGYVQTFVPSDLAYYDEVLITEESGAFLTVQPSGPVRWNAAVTPAVTP
jgi:hypothetical protein